MGMFSHRLVLGQVDRMIVALFLVKFLAMDVRALRALVAMQSKDLVVKGLNPMASATSFRVGWGIGNSLPVVVWQICYMERRC